MAARPLEATVRGGPEVTTIALHGQVDRDADTALVDAYSRAGELGSGAIVVDFADVDYINSTGIALIVRLLAEARRDHREIRARGLSEHYREIFRITRLADFMTMLDEAPAAAGRTGGGRG
jgi:anti-sigma B factor antagonist